MRCISPLLVRNGCRRDFVPCGKCNFCLSVKRADWSFRLTQELRRAETAKFLTLTYSDECLPADYGLDKTHLQLFKKRLRKANSKLCDWRIRYYSVGEYGTQTSRPHYHSILFNAHPKIDFAAIWNQGHVYVGNVTAASIHYVTKYVINRVGDYPGRAPPFAVMSKRPGIGSNYLETHKEWHRAGMRSYVEVNGIKARLPRYYKEKMFTQLERQVMAQTAIHEGDVAYLEEVDRLTEFYDDPYVGYELAVQNKHDLMTRRLNEKNKF